MKTLGTLRFLASKFFLNSKKLKFLSFLTLQPRDEVKKFFLLKIIFKLIYELSEYVCFILKIFKLQILKILDTALPSAIAKVVEDDERRRLNIDIGDKKFSLFAPLLFYSKVKSRECRSESHLTLE